MIGTLNNQNQKGSQTSEPSVIPACLSSEIREHKYPITDLIREMHRYYTDTDLVVPRRICLGIVPYLRVLVS